MEDFHNSDYYVKGVLHQALAIYLLRTARSLSASVSAEASMNAVTGVPREGLRRGVVGQRVDT
jgi:hypothetical protein